MERWAQKASLIISQLAWGAYKKANTNKCAGKIFKQHRPYTLPPLADELVKALGLADREAAEKRVKELFIIHDIGADDMLGFQ